MNKSIILDHILILRNSIKSLIVFYWHVSFVSFWLFVFGFVQKKNVNYCIFTRLLLRYQSVFSLIRYTRTALCEDLNNLISERIFDSVI